jgi:two-component system, chemotaxis family, sensor kinase CheA
MNDAEVEFLDMFRDEANERIDSMVDALLALESGDADPDALNSLFRDVHTIKGGAGMLGLDDAQSLAHAIEDVLESAREAGEFPRPLADPLLRAADALRLHIAGDSEATPDLLAELGARSAGALVGGSSGTPEADPVDVPAAQVEVAVAPAERRGIRVSPQKIDRLLDLVGETVLHRRRLEHVLGGDRIAADEDVADELDHGERLFDELKVAAVQMRTLPISTITGGLPRAVRDIAAAAGKDVELVVSGDSTELDRVILESLSEPLVHLLRNAVAHGIESPEERIRTGKPARAIVELRAEQRGGTVEIVVADDGRGVSREILAEAKKDGSLANVLARAGFSTAEEITELSGRGVGLDAVKQHVESFGGTVEAFSATGKGTRIVLVLPLALALLEVLLVERDGHAFGVPLATIEEAIAVEDSLRLEGRSSLELRGRSVPLVDLAALIGCDAPPLARRAPAIVIVSGGRRVAAWCDRLLGQEEIVVKPLGPLLASVKGYLGGAILGDGRIALLLDPTALTRAKPSVPKAGGGAIVDPARQLGAKVLVVEDSYTVREMQRSILEAAGYRVETARDGKEGLERVSTDDEIALVITDLEMPEMDGLELTRAIRARNERSSLPVVVVTSLGDDEDRRRGVEAGANAYIVKRAFDQQALLDIVERLVGR